jgi:tetratricopeptide (TPR) repeat protein
MSNDTTRLEIAILNNEGSDLIETGDIDGAMECFSSMLKAARILLRHHGDEKDSTSVTAAEFSLDHFIKFEAANEYYEGFEDDDTQGFFRRPIRIPSRSFSILRENDGKSGQIISAIGIFNFALSFHLSASLQRSTDTKNDLLQKAVRLYELAFQMHNSSGIASRSAFFHMAILNNLAHAHAVLGSKKVAEDCYRQLLSTLMFLIDTQRVELPVNATFDCFFRSTYHLIFTGNSQAAAAA